MRHLFSALALAALTSYPMAGLAQDTPKPRYVNLIFNVDLRLEGNVSAIDSGVEVTCSFDTEDVIGAIIGTSRSVVAVPPGPVTTPGVVPVQIRIENLSYQELFEVRPDLGGINWECHITKPGQTYPNNIFVAPGTQRSISPAFIGTCTSIGGDIYHSTQASVTRWAPYCATK